LHELKGFFYATILDLNMGYYTIRLEQDASKICTSSFLGASILTQEINQWIWQLLQAYFRQNVGANGIPRVCTGIEDHLDNLDGF
jgi:hypothetical protein